jgi:hypothetical protein
MDEPPRPPAIELAQAPHVEVISDQKQQQKQNWSRSYRELTNE